MIKVYNPSMMADCFNDWFVYDQYGNKNSDFTPTENLNEVLEQKIKIATIPMHYEEYDPTNKFDFDPEQFDLCLISDIEQSTVEECCRWTESKKIKQYCIAVGSLEYRRVNELPENVLYRPWWMFNLLNLNTIQNQVVSEKTLDFDVLLGARKQHRDFVMAKFQTENMLANNLVNYRSVFLGKYGDNQSLNKHLELLLQGTKLNYPYISDNLDATWEVKEEISRDVSAIIPWKIYANTKYSIVCETNYERGFFATEKTGKAIIAKRLFIVFSSANFLQNLRDLGFMTFGEILDESYDQETDIVKRYEMAFDQVRWLSTQNYKDIMKKAMPILDHNQKRLHILRQETKQQMQKMVYNKLEEIKC